MNISQWQSTCLYSVKFQNSIPSTAKEKQEQKQKEKVKEKKKKKEKFWRPTNTP